MVQMLTAYGAGRANVNDVMRALVSHRGWFVPLAMFAPQQASRVLMALIGDGLQMPSGFVAESSYRCLAYCKVPSGWLEGDVPESDELWIKGLSLKPDKLERLYEAMYGKAWRSGNSDGSQYVVMATGARLLNSLRESERPWEKDDPNDKRFRFFYFAADADGQLKPVSHAEL